MMSTRPEPRFPGVLKPTVDFGPILSELRTTPQMLTVDLTTARSGQTALVLPITGNVLYIDSRAGTGTAELILIDDSMTPGPARITVSAGYVLRTPFRSIAIENTAQPGNTLRLIYGVDVEFSPGQGAGVSILGTPTVTFSGSPAVSLPGGTAITGEPTFNITKVNGNVINNNRALQVHDFLLANATVSNYSNATAMTAGSVQTVLTPAANNTSGGVLIRRAQFMSFVSGGTDYRQMALLAQFSAPTSISDGFPVCMADSSGGSLWVSGKLDTVIRIPSGMGLYWYAIAAETQGQRSVFYSALN
jgi:hypothetical protein